MTVDATYESGVLRPATPLRLRPGERVRIIVVRRADPSRWRLDALGAAGAGEDGELAETGLKEWTDALRREDER